MVCFKCHNQDGPFVVDTRRRRCVCEDCYYLDMAAYYAELYIKNKVKDPVSEPMRAIAHMGVIERTVYDNLNIKY